ncbi:KGK domain-containing protein [Synechococcus sp. R3-13]|uniref:KGK domain-containing protein n=1 Tax=Synechococcus sp. R3-13 TaxID=2421316 RepID=UPI0039C4A826
MTKTSINLSRLGDGVITFINKNNKQKVYMISKLCDSINSYFLRFDQMGRELNSHLSSSEIQTDIPSEDRVHFFHKGVPCSILSPKTNGWQTGRVKVRVEVTIDFYPDNPEFLIKEPDQEILEPLDEKSPLDDLRSMDE